jgi:uncharacterized protein
MINNIADEEYKKIVDYILKDEEFNKLSNNIHHGTDRLSHSLRVSYYSYLVSKKLRLDYETTATAGLLHDFFMADYEENFKDKFKLLYNHPKIASENAMNKFGITEKEKNIIESHMFPLCKRIPKHAESWVVTTVDKIVGLFEDGIRFKYAATLWLVFIINIVK